MASPVPALAAIPLRVVQLVELPEHPLLFGRRDARPGIADQDAHAAAPMPAADQHAAAPGMRDGVADEIAQDALQQHRIRIHHRLAGPDPQRQAFLHRLRRILGPQLLQQRIEREPLAPGLDHAGVQPGDIEQGIEQMPHRRRRAGDVVHQVAAVRGEFLVGQQAQEQADREHGLAQVMAGGGQEARFFQVAALGRLLLAPHLLQQRQILVAQPQGVQVGAMHAVRERQRGGHIGDSARHHGDVQRRRLRRQRDEGRRQRRDLEGVDDRQDDVVGIDRPVPSPIRITMLNSWYSTGRKKLQ